MSKSSTGYLFECYIWLVNTISRGPISRKAIGEKWAHASVNDYQTDAIPDSTFHRWRNTAELLFDITIKCNASGEYYIDGVTDLHRTDLRGRILTLLSVNNMLRDCHETLRKQILFFLFFFSVFSISRSPCKDASCQFSIKVFSPEYRRFHEETPGVPYSATRR